MKMIGEKDLMDFLPEEEQALAIVEIKNILAKAMSSFNSPALQEKMIIAVTSKLDVLIETIKEANNTSYRHDIVRGDDGIADHLITSPLKIRLKVSK